MQKQVSKQSLAMVALSILLAISIALTFTFAAFSTSKTVTSTVTFTAPSLSITLELPTEHTHAVLDTESGNITVTLEQTDFTIDGNGIMTIKEAVETEIAAISFSIVSTVANAYAYSISYSEVGLVGSETTPLPLITSTPVSSTSVEDGDATTAVTGNLGDIIEFNSILSKTMTSETDYFTIVFKANYGTAVNA